MRIVLGDETARGGDDFDERLRVLTGPLLYSQLTTDLKWTRDDVEAGW